MTTTPINDTSIASGFNVDELTEGSLTGKGVLDVLLQTLRLHLDREFTSGRITGTAYATVYAQAITAFLAQAAQYALSKAKLPLELQLLEKQITLAQKQQDQITAAIRQSDYVTDFQLPSEVANKDKTTALLEYDLTYLKPVELSIAQEDLALKQAQTSLVEYDLTTIKPQELALLTQKVANETYIVQHRLPAEVADIEAGVALKDYELTDVQPAQVAQVTAQTAQVTYTTANLIPAQIASTTAQTSQITYTTYEVLPKQVLLTQAQIDAANAQVEQVTADTALKAKELDIRTYELTFIKPQELALTTQQVATQQYTVQTRMPAELAGIQAETSLKAYELTDMKPSEKAQLVAQTSHVVKQELNTIQQTINMVSQNLHIEQQTANLTSQQSQIEAETGKLLYETTYILPENKKVVQYTQDRILAETNKIANETVVTIKQGKLTDAQTANTTAQTDLYAQKKVTELAQTTTTPAATSVMGVQNALMVKQTANYKRDAEQKAAKIMIDTWNVRRNQDADLADTLESNRLREQDIGIAVTALLAGLSA